MLHAFVCSIMRLHSGLMTNITAKMSRIIFGSVMSIVKEIIEQDETFVGENFAETRLHDAKDVPGSEK